MSRQGVYNAAIIGCGTVASGYDRVVPSERPLSHAGAYHLHPRTRLVAAADSDEERLYTLGDRWGIRRLYRDAADLLESEPDLHVLSICSPTACHVDHTTAALARGVPCIFLEKPVAPTLAEAEALVKIADGRGGIAVNYYRRFSLYFRAFCERLHRGDLGVSERCRFLYTRGLIHNGTHFLDLARWLFGSPTSCRAITWSAINSRDWKLDALLTFPSGLLCYLEGCCDGNTELNIMEMDLLTSRGRVQFEKGGRVFRYFSLEQDDLYPGRLYLEPASEAVRSGSEGAFLDAVDNLVKYLDGQDTLCCTLDDGCEALRLASSLLRSAAEDGHVVDLTDRGASE